METRDITVEQLALLADALGSLKSNASGMVGKYVIVRCQGAGVHAGILERHFGEECTLKESRRLWSWVNKNKKDLSLSGIAVHGVGEGSKIEREINVHLTGVCEIIECSEEAKKSLRGFKSA